MIHHKVSAAVAGQAKGNQIFSALQISPLCVRNDINIPVFPGRCRDPLKHCIRAGDLRTAHILDRKRKNRILDLRMELHAYF